MTPEQYSKPQSFQKFTVFFVATLLFAGAVGALWPFYKYYIDPDAISYLILVKDYLAGNYHQAVNAFWSPMGCWLTVIWVQLTGWPLFASAIFVNALGGWATLISGQFLFHKFRKSRMERWCFGLCMALFWAYVVYIQSFTDIWQCFYLTAGLNLLLKKDFEQKPLLWILAGALAALSYFSKAYSFYFFPLMILVVSGLKLKQVQQYRFRKHLSIVLVAGLTMLVIAAPWLYLLHEKYGVWTTSTAGQLNLTWWLEGTQKTKPGMEVLVPPPYKNTSIFYFEDPLLAQGHFVHFWDSPRLFLKFLARIGYNAFLWVTSSNAMSPFYFIIWLIAIPLILKRTQKIFNNGHKILVIVFLIFPLPYWLMTFDNGRYLWFTLPLCMIIGIRIFEKSIMKFLRERAVKILIPVFFLTFLVTPVLNLKEHFKDGFREHDMAEQLKQLQIKGSFAANLSFADGSRILPDIAWFSGNAWYCYTLSEYSTEEILEDARRYNVRYYFYFYEGTGDDYRLKDRNGTCYPEVTGGRIPGLKVFQLR